MYEKKRKKDRGPDADWIFDHCVLRVAENGSLPPEVDLRAPFGPTCFRYASFKLPDGRTGAASSGLCRQLGIDPDELMRAAYDAAGEKPLEFEIVKVTTYAHAGANGEIGDSSTCAEYLVRSTDGTEPSFAFASDESLKTVYREVGGPYCFVLPKLAPAYVVSGQMETVLPFCANALIGSLGRPVLGGQIFSFDGKNLSFVMAKPIENDG